MVNDKEIDWTQITSSQSNPVAFLRERLGMSQQSFSKASGVPLNTLYYTELGMVTNIPTKIHDYLARRNKFYNKDKVNTIFSDWVINARRQVLTENPLPPVAEIFKNYTLLDIHPFKYYIAISECSISGFCALIKISKSVIYGYITPGKQQAMPVSLYNALIQCGLSSKDVNELDRAGIAYYRDTLKSRINERRDFNEHRQRAG